MTPAFEKLQQALKRLPGVGYRSAERIALHLLVEKPARLPELVAALEEAARTVRRCTRCGNLAEGDLCGVCADERRDQTVVCVVEHTPDLVCVSCLVPVRKRELLGYARRLRKALPARARLAIGGAGVPDDVEPETVKGVQFCRDFAQLSLR